MYVAVHRDFLDQYAASTHVLYSSEDVQATLYTLRCGTQLVLKITSEGRADFEWRQVRLSSRIVLHCGPRGVTVMITTRL